MMYLRVLLAVIAASSFQPTLGQTNKVVCYYSGGLAFNFAPEAINIDICTHINYAFVDLNEDGTINLGDTDLITRIGALKNQNPNLKVLLSIGGWREDGGIAFSIVAKDPAKLQTMAQSAIGIFQQYRYDGLDVDWEFPNGSGGTPEDKENFVTMLRTLRDAFAPYEYLVTTAVNSLGDPASYDIAGISEVVDYINLMTYDFHWGTEKTGQNSPLYPSSTDSDWEKSTSCVDAGVTIWLNGGAAANKIVVGTAFYGRTFTLADPNQHGVAAPAIGPGLGSGALGYRDICVLTDGWSTVWDEEQRVPYKYSGDQWIGFDNPDSIREKASYAVSRGLSGVMMWTVNHDDVGGNCGPVNALLLAIQEGMRK